MCRTSRHQTKTTNPAKTGHSKAYAQLSVLPPAARLICHQPNARNATTSAIAATWRAIHAGVQSRFMASRVPGRAALSDAVS